MFGFNWRQHAPLGFGIAGVVLAFVIAGLLNHSEDRQRHYGSAQQHPPYTLDGVERRFVPTITGHETPPADPKPDRKEWREEQTLEASGEQAYWAKWAAIAAFVTRQTLEANRAAVRTMQDTAKRELRAYVGHKDYSLQISAPGGEIVTFALSAVIENTGNTPARQCEVWARPSFQVGGGIPRFDKGPAPPERSASSIGSGQNRFGPMVTIAWGDFERMARDECVLFMWLRVEYKDVFGADHHTETCCRVDVHFTDFQRHIGPGMKVDSPFRYRFLGPQNTED